MLRKAWRPGAVRKIIGLELGQYMLIILDSFLYNPRKSLVYVVNSQVLLVGILDQFSRLLICLCDEHWLTLLVEKYGFRE